MQDPIQVTFRDLDVSDAVRTLCEREAEKLEHYFDRITSCRVTIGRPHQHHRKGNHWVIGIVLAVPGEQLVVNRAPAEHRADEQIEVAVREAFDALRRELMDYVRRRRGDVKHHESGSPKTKPS